MNRHPFSVEEKVRLMVESSDLQEICSVAMYDEISNEWVTFTEDKNGEPIMMNSDWTPQEIDEFIMIRLLELTDADMAIDDNDRLVTGWVVVDNNHYSNTQVIRLRTGQGHLVVIVIIW